MVWIFRIREAIKRITDYGLRPDQALPPKDKAWRVNKLCWPTAGGLKKVIARSAIQIKGAFIITRSVIIYLSRGSE